MAHSHALAHLGVFVDCRLALRAALKLALSKIVFNRVSLVDIEGQIFLQLLDLGLLDLNLVEVCLSLRLEGRV